MRPGRRTVLGGLGAVGSVALAGCLGTVDSLLGTGSDRPGYLDWLPPPGTLLPPDRYRFASIRPQHLTHPPRVTPLLPPLSGTGLDPWAATRIVAGNGGYGVTTDFDQQTVVETLRDHGYEYVDGVGDAWVMAHDATDRPVYAVGTTHLAAGYSTPMVDAATVAHTLIRAQYSTPHWTDATTQLTPLFETLGDPPLFVVGRHDRTQTDAPARAAFADAIGWGIAEHGDDVTVAILYPTDTDPVLAPVETWADATFDNPSLATTESVLTIEVARPPRPWTLLPVPDRSWPMSGADPAHTAAQPTTRAVSDPVGVDWTHAATVNGTVTPVVTDTDTAYLGVGDLLAVDLADGTKRWRVDTTITGPPAVADDTVITPVDGGVLGVDATDGTTTWFHPLPDTTPTAPVVTGDTVFVGLTPPDPGGILALSSTTGERNWAALDTPVDTVPAVADHILYTTGDANGHHQRRLHALATTDGTQHWQTTLPESISHPLAVDSTHVYAATTARVTAINRDTHTPDWSTPVTDDPLSGPPALHDDRVVLTHTRPGTSRPGSLTVRTAQTGDTLLTTQLDHAVVGHPTIAGDTVVLTSPTGTLAAYDVGTGVRDWQTPVGGHLYPPTAIDDQLLLTTTAGRITAVATNWLPTN